MQRRPNHAPDPAKECPAECQVDEEDKELVPRPAPERDESGRQVKAEYDDQDSDLDNFFSVHFK